jgi:hypothetical protein
LSVADVAAALQTCGGRPAYFQTYFSGLDAMMTRRHNILHRADRQEASGSGNYRPHSLSKGNVTGWINNAEEFGRRVFATIPSRRAGA